MTLDRNALLDGLNSVTSIPLIPYDGDQIDFDGHAKNIDYLMQNNHLSDNRPRVISIAGTSLIHHVRYDDQVKLLDIAGQQMGADGILRGQGGVPGASWGVKAASRWSQDTLRMHGGGPPEKMKDL